MENQRTREEKREAIEANREKTREKQRKSTGKNVVNFAKVLEKVGARKGND